MPVRVRVPERAQVRVQALESVPVPGLVRLSGTARWVPSQFRHTQLGTKVPLMPRR